MTVTLLCDVDKVLNVSRCGERAGWRQAVVHSANDRSDYTITWSPELIGRLAEMHTRGVIEWVWCSTWSSEADVLERLWGLPELRRSHADHLKGWYAMRAKHDALKRELAAGRRVAWVDDHLSHILNSADLKDLAGRGLAFQRESALPERRAVAPRGSRLSAARVLLIQPFGDVGLTTAHADLIEAFAQEHAP